MNREFRIHVIKINTFNYMNTKGINTRRFMRAAFGFMAALAASAGLGSCIGLDAALDSGGVYWSVDDYIGAPGIYGPGWGAPAPPPPAFAPVPGPYPPVYPVGPNRPPAPVSPSKPGKPDNVNPGRPGGSGSAGAPGGGLRPGNPGRPTGTPSRPQGSSTRPRK